MANLRISGLASGMDIDSIVSDMMKIKRMPLDKLKQEKQVMEWQRDDYREMNTLLLDFRSELTQMKLTTRYRTRTTTTTDDSRVTATASSAAALSSFSISSVTQLASAETLVNSGSIYNDSSFDPNKSMFDQQAKLDSTGFAWQTTGAVMSKSISVKNGGNTVETELSNIKANTQGTWSVKVNGVGYKVVTDATKTLGEKEVLIDQSGNLTFGKTLNKDSVVKVDYIANERTDTLNIPTTGDTLKLNKGAIDSVGIKFIKTIDGVKEEPINLNLNDLGNNLFLITDGSGKSYGTLNKATGEISLDENLERPEKDSKTTMSFEVTYDHKYTTFSIDTDTSKGDRHDTFLVSASDSLNSVINQVNSSSVGVNMFYDSVTGQMTMTRNETGDFNNDPNKTDTTFSGLFITSMLKFDPNAAAKVQGLNAIFTVNGLETNRTSNTFDINGVSFTLNKTFEATEPPVTIAINNDSNAVFENIKGFIEKYNELIGKIQKKIQEERFRDYAPLTDEQRESLSDKQQEQWEEKAKSGLLRRDSALSSLLSSMRTDFYGSVESEDISPLFNQLAKIGIKTTANYLEGGKLEINEAQLKKAIEEDPLSVEKLFNATGTTNGQRGIAQRLYDTVGRTMDIITEKAGKSFSTSAQFTIGRQLKNLENQIDRFEDRMIQLEDRYYRQFTAMEKAIQQANQQSAYIMNNMFNF
ncbi:flagellar filament capping protein FliD [Niallia sp. Krafla_26]|uniref:flagellar filament capping protein FliD n=1 Tax=Niallia sp. Krafla_26 TaxID=3064703 RepID=UPI003D182197